MQMSAAVRMKPLGSTQQLHWVAKELDTVALLFGLAAIRCDYVHLLYIFCVDMLIFLMIKEEVEM